MSQKKNMSQSGLTRRTALARAAQASAAALAGGAAAAAAANAQSGDEISVAVNGVYRTAPLKKESIRVTAVQSAIRAADPDNPRRVMRDNLNRMLDHIDNANGFPGKQDLVCFHEQPIMGWNPWTREQALKVSIEVPGRETEAIGKKAKEHGCYVAFGSYVVDEDWPRHLLLNGILIGPDGNVAAQHWKQHNVRLGREWTMFTTSAYDVLDRYIEMYGADAVLPVARTDIGNLSLLISPYDPDIHRAIALKGMEIGIRFSSGGFAQEDSKSSSLFNQNYTITVNNSLSRDNPGFPEYSGPGGTSIYGPFGREVAMAKSVHEEYVRATIPVGSFRRTHRPPDIPMALVMPVYERYTPPNPPGLQLAYLPKDLYDAARYYNENRTW